MNSDEKARLVNEHDEGNLPLISLSETRPEEDSHREEPKQVEHEAARFTSHVVRAVRDAGHVLRIMVLLRSAKDLSTILKLYGIEGSIRAE